MRRLLFVILLSSLVLVACQSETPQPFKEASTTVSSRSSAEIPSASDEPISAPTLSANIETVGEPAPGCTVVSPRPTPGPTQESIFYPIDEDEWATGPETAQLTLIEYGDFQ